MKILLIDDDPFAAKLLTTQLGNLGFTRVTYYEQAKTALIHILKDLEHFDLLFCDLQMPDMDGIELLRNLAEVDYRGKLVLVTGEDASILKTAEMLAKARGLEISGVLQKPVSVDQLAQILAYALEPCLQKKTSFVTHEHYSLARLSQAISAGELENYYQPKVDLDSGNLIGVEALVRWHHPINGLVFPDQFIPLIEKYDLIDNLTQKVLINALNDARVWYDQGFEFSVAVNVSMDNLTHIDFPDQVEQAINQAGVSASNLILEVTESQLMADPLMALDILTRLRLKQIRLSIDDFGTGHSSLVQLHDLPFTELKIDQSFVHNAHADESIRAILEGCLSMAKKLGMSVVVEGVETIDDWQFIRASGCDMAQGYFMAKPMRATEIADWLSIWQTRIKQHSAHNAYKGELHLLTTMQSRY